MVAKKNDLWTAVREQLLGQGIDLEALACGEGGLPGALKVVCIGTSMRESVDELGSASRDQVVMVRVDADTLADLDAWVETGAVKSRSEAAALFIREGLQVRTAELRELKDAIDGVDEARSRLRKKASEVLGADHDNTSGEEER